MQRGKQVEKPKKKRGLRLVLFLARLFLLVSVGLFAVSYLGEYVPQDGYAMNDTIVPCGGALVSRLWYAVKDPERFEVAACEVGGKLQLRRIVGLPGEEIQISDGAIWIDGQPLARADQYFGVIDIPGLAEEPIRLGEDEYFVLGDNPARSQDSRFADTGTIQREQLYGRAWLAAAPSQLEFRLIWNAD